MRLLGEVHAQGQHYFTLLYFVYVILTVLNMALNQ